MTLSINRVQNGMALIIALLLLLVLTVLGVAGMSSGLMQERMAGNVNLQTLSFEAASAGVARSLEYGLDRDNWDEDSCTRGSGEWYNQNWTDFFPISVPGLPDGIVVEYRQRFGCVEPDPVPVEWEDPEFLVPNQLLVLNQGQVRRVADGAVLARREVEVRVENRGGDSQCAIRIEGTVSSENMPNSNFSVDGGEGGCPLSISEGGGADELKEVIGSNRIGNYQPENPGIHESEGFGPWNNAERFAQIANMVKTGIQGYENYMAFVGATGETDQELWHTELADQIDDPDTSNDERDYLQRLLDFAEDRNIVNCKGTFYSGHTRMGGSSLGGGCDVDFGSAPTSPPHAKWINRGNDIVVGDPTDPLHLTYVAGHLGNPGQNGSGILITEGANCWNANATFKGLQLNLGGHYEMIGGGGQNHTTDGAIVLTRLNDKYGQEGTPDFWALNDSGDLRRLLAFDEDDVGFDHTDLFFAGGGGHSINFRCVADDDGPGMHEFVERLNSCLQLDEPIEPNCDPDGGGQRKAIASWREYIDRQRWPND